MEKIKIVNPAYDAAFKYLMEDKQIAITLLSDILQVNIVDLVFKPKEFIVTPKIPTLKGKKLKLYRLDFKAKIQLSDGSYQVVLIEIQRSRLPMDLFRFRTYLGEQYLSRENYLDPNNPIHPLPIISIYFLGYTCKKLEDLPIGIYANFLTKRGSQQIINVDVPFLKALSHTIILVQLPVIQKIYPSDDLEKALKIFDPNPQTYYLYINPDQVPKKYHKLLKRLNMAVKEPHIVRKMMEEDYITLSFLALMRKLKKLKQYKKLYEKAEQEKLQAETKMLKLEQEKLKAENKMLKLEQEKFEQTIKFAKKLLELNVPIDEIAQITGLSPEQILKLKEQR